MNFVTVFSVNDGLIKTTVAANQRVVPNRRTR
ncbi:hypothetical protein OKW40_005292 [Paraburkholderia sp. RAU6.4a]